MEDGAVDVVVVAEDGELKCIDIYYQQSTVLLFLMEVKEVGRERA